MRAVRRGVPGRNRDRRARAARHRLHRDGARHHRAAASGGRAGGGARPRARGRAREVGVRGQHEPRDPHADEQRVRHDRPAARTRAVAASSASTSAVLRRIGGGLLRIIDDMLDFSKIEAGKLDARVDPVRRCGALLDETIARARGARPRARPELLAAHVAADVTDARDRRPGPPAPGAAQPGRQRHQVHRARRGRAGRRGARAVGAGRAPSLLRFAVTRHRHRHPAREAGRRSSRRSRRPTGRRRGATAARVSGSPSRASSWR